MSPDTQEHFANFLRFMSGWIACMIYFYLKARLEMPYRWKCPVKGCSVAFKGSTKDVLDMAKRSHPPHDPKENA